MIFEAYGWAAHVGALLSGTATLAAVTVSVRDWKKHSSPIDFAYTVGALAWLTYLLVSNLGSMAPSSRWAVFASHVGYQIAVVGVSFFLLISASITSLRIHTMWMAQSLVGLLLLLAWGMWVSLAPHWTYRLWVASNLVFSSLICLYLGFNVYRQRTYRSWLVFGSGLLGLGICMEDLLSASRLYSGTTLTQYFYASFLLVMWLLITNRVGRPEPKAVLGTDRSLSNWENVTGFSPDTDFSTPAVNNERRRIAQDLHDGVGSQLVNILATLDTRAPQQQAVALALEQCLVDLKIMVDSIESTEGSVLDALGRLRYRVQHALDKLGIHMVWNVDMDGPLDEFCGDRAQQVLRITQECLSNIMRHSGASVIKVICRYQPESDSLLLEVNDNGCGITSREPARSGGKGLQGLQRRADKLGGRLQITTRAQRGTRVRLLVSLHGDERTS